MTQYDKERLPFLKASLTRFYYGAYDFDKMPINNIFEYLKYANKIINDENKQFKNLG